MKLLLNQDTNKSTEKPKKKEGLFYFILFFIFLKKILTLIILDASKGILIQKGTPKEQTPPLVPQKRARSPLIEKDNEKIQKKRKMVVFHNF